jgi:hypothetical protein
LGRNVGMSAVSDNSSLAFLASFRIKFRENNFVVFLYITFYFFLIIISKFTAVIKQGNIVKINGDQAVLPQ